jgi:hypothetical protein
MSNLNFLLLFCACLQKALPKILKLFLLNYLLLLLLLFKLLFFIFKIKKDDLEPYKKLEDPSKKWKVVKYSKKPNSVFRGHLMCMNAPKRGGIFHLN